MPATRKIYNSGLLFWQGIILVVFSFFIFTQPGALIEKLAFAAGGVAICTAGAYLVRYFFGEDPGRFFPDLFTGIALMGIGFILLKGDSTWFMGTMVALIILLALNAFLAAFEMKYAFKWWWLSVITGFGSLYISYLVITGYDMAGLPLSSPFAILILLLGLLMIWLSILDKRIEREYRKTLKELRETGY